jgi:hypothetical protein
VVREMALPAAVAGASPDRLVGIGIDEVCFSAAKSNVLMRRGTPQRCLYVVVDGMVGLWGRGADQPLR